MVCRQTKGAFALAALLVVLVVGGAWAGTAGAADSDDSFGDGVQVTVTVAPTGESFQSNGTMEIFVGAFNDTEPKIGVGGEQLNVSVHRPDGTTEYFDVTTDAEGRAQVDYDLSVASRGNGTYDVVVERANGTTRAEVSTTVGPTIAAAERDYETVPMGSTTDFDFLVRNGEFGQSGEPVNISVEAPNGTVVQTRQVTTDEAGFASIDVTPTQTGQYDVTAELVSTGATATHSATANEYVLRTSAFELDEAIAGYRSYYGGYIVDGDGPVANTDLVVAVTNDSGVEIENETVTTGPGGFFFADFLTNDTSVDVSIQTANGTVVVDRDYVGVDDPYPGGGGGSGPGAAGVELSVSTRESAIVPGSNVTLDIEATDNGSALAGQTVTVFPRMDYDGAPLASRTVTTDENGAAVVTFEVPSGADGAEVDGVAAMEYNGSLVTDSLYGDVEAYEIDFDTPYGAGVGQQVNLSVQAVRADTGEGVEGVPLQFNALRAGDTIDTYATGEMVTNATGVGTASISVPRDVEPYSAIARSTRYYEPGSVYRVNVFDLPGSMTIDSGAVNEFGRPVASPGEEISIDFATPNGTAASGIAFASFDHNNSNTYANGNAIVDVSAGTNATMTIPAYAESDSWVNVVVWAADQQGNYYTAERAIEVNASGGGDQPLDVDLAATPSTAESGTNVTLDATASESVVEYRWDVDGDGTDEETTSGSTLTFVANETGSYTASVTAVASDGDTASATAGFTVVDTTPPTAIVDGPASIATGEQVSFDASASADNSYIANYTWTVTNGGQTVRERTTQQATTSFTFAQTGAYNLSLTATDSAGNANTTTVPFTVVASANLATTVEVQERQRYGEAIAANVSVTNTGSENATTPFRVQYTYSGTTHENGTPREASGNLTISQSVDAGATVQRTVLLSDWVTTNRVTGDVTFEAVADPDGNVSEARDADNDDSAGFTVTYPDLATTVSSSTVATAATNTTIYAYVHNEGTASSATTNATVTVTDDTGSVVQSDTVSVGALAPERRNRTRITPALAAGEYTVTATVDDPTFPAGNHSTTTVQVESYNLTASDARVPAELEVGQNTTVAFTYRPNDVAPVNATLTLEGSGLAFQNETGDSLTKTIVPTANRPNVVTYDLQAVDVTNQSTQLAFRVNETGGADAASLTAATNVTVVTETVSNTASLTHEASTTSTNLTIYDSGVTEDHELTVSVQAGSHGRTLEGLEYLVEYPYGCVEQTTSAFLGALNTDQYYRDRPDATIAEQFQQRINDSIAEGIQRLNGSGIRAQQPDGSWNMWGQSGAPGDTFYSVYALYGTSEVANDPIYGPKNEESLDGVDFDQAVAWLNDEDQNADGSFSADAYIDDAPAMTGFTIVAVNNTARTERVTSETRANITELQAEGTSYLLAQRNASSGAWNDGDARSTALAVRGLQIALDNGVAAETAANESEIQAAIDDGRQWLIDTQRADGSWEPYHDSAYWSTEGDTSVTTAYALLALSETGMDANNDTITSGTEYLIDVYETDGSWGYPRATAISIEALDRLTSGATNGTMTVDLSSDAGTVQETVTVNGTTPERTITLDQSQLETLRGSGNGTTTVEVTVSDQGSSGTIVVGVETTQEIVVDQGGGSQ